MAQPKRNLASALAYLYFSRGGSESDLNDVMDSADIVAKLYHLLGGKVATPKGMPMAELVALLSTTQGGGGGSASLFVTENNVNDAPIITQAQLTYVDGVGERNITLNSGSMFAVQMSQDGSNNHTFSIEGDRGKIGGVATYNAKMGGYVYQTSEALDTSTNFTVTFEKQIK